ncbi:MAG TPA: hypothetical protein VFV33_21560 [Gemmatimonadaceae bacterium]|nr:hypothetical protein [Gemmatimonadaceae bacterium]
MPPSILSDLPRQDRGALTRSRRVALGLSVTELARRVGVPSVHLLRVEEGLLEPVCGWTAIRDELRCELGRVVDRRIAAGEDPRTIRVGPWPAVDVLDAGGIRAPQWRS